MKKTRLFLTVIFAMSILAVLSFSGYEEFDTDYTVKYEITGPAIVAFLIQYRDGSGRVFSIKTYTAKVYVNGKVKDSSTGSEDNIMASCLIK